MLLTQEKAEESEEEVGDELMWLGAELLVGNSDKASLNHILRKRNIAKSSGRQSQEETVLVLMNRVICAE